MPNGPTVLLVEDQQLLRLGLRVALEAQGCCEVIGEAADGESASRETQRLRPDIVLMDVGLPKVDGIEATWKIKQQLPRTRVIIFTCKTDPVAVSESFGAGADAYCAKDAPVEQIMSAMNAVLRGEVWLDPAIADVVVRAQNNPSNAQGSSMSDQELEILALIRQKMDSSEIARRLNTDTETIIRIMHNIISHFQEGRAIDGTSEQKQREHLNEWLTACVDNLEEGAVFNEKYLVQKLVGSGGLGAVFKAKHMYIERTVALKLLRPEVSNDRLAMRSFQREATAIANIQHKNIVGVYDFGISVNHEPFLIMEYVDGTNMADILLENRRLLPSRVVNLGMQVCDGLNEAHAKGVVHCDLKPSNILLTGTLSQETVKLVDFGLVQLTPRDGSSAQLKQTERYFVCGTPAYMSPEQCAGKALDARSDIYSLGCVLFEALTGELPFTGNSPMEIFAKQLQVEAPKLSATCPEVTFPRGLEELVARMLAKEPGERPQSMAEVRASLSSIEVQPGREHFFTA